MFLYLTGHGGDGFLKFLDHEELGAEDLAAGIQEMWDKRRYRRLLVVAETCQAETLPAAIEVSIYLYIYV